ncbi:MAG: hypothetical protein QM775_04310 [Pirellulales bacterium]
MATGSNAGLWGAIAAFVPSQEQGKRGIRLRLRKAGFGSQRSVAIYFVVRLVSVTLPIVVGVVAFLWKQSGWGSVVIGCLSLAGAGFLLPSLWLDSTSISAAAKPKTRLS